MRVEKFLETYDIKGTDYINTDILSLKIKGLTEKLELHELYSILTNDVRARGISYLDDLLTDNSNNNSEYKESLNENAKKLKLYLIIIQNIMILLMAILLIVI